MRSAGHVPVAPAALLRSPGAPGGGTAGSARAWRAPYRCRVCPAAARQSGGAGGGPRRPRGRAAGGRRGQEPPQAPREPAADAHQRHPGDHEDRARVHQAPPRHLRGERGSAPRPPPGFQTHPPPRPHGPAQAAAQGGMLLRDAAPPAAPSWPERAEPAPAREGGPFSETHPTHTARSEPFLASSSDVPACPTASGSLWAQSLSMPWYFPCFGFWAALH